MRINAPLLLIFTLFLFSIAFASNPIVPSNILTYVPIQLSNSQNSIYPQNSQIMLTVNSLAYESYESNTLQNIEFFYSNGTLIPSWLEGNSLNEKQTTNLYTSQNTIYWLRIFPANSFLGNDASNTIYMGIAMTSTNLLGTRITGESPLLSSSYGQYDNGNNVFSSYWNFAGGSAPSGISSSVSSGSVTFGNGVVVKGSTSSTGGENEVSTASDTVSTNTIYEFYGAVPTDAASASWTWSEYGFTESPTCGSGFFECSPYLFTDYGYGSGGIELYDSFGGTQTTNQYGSTGYINGMFGFALSSNSYYSYENYSTIRASATGTSTISSGTMYFAAGLGNNAGSFAPNGLTIYYLRARDYPGSGISLAQTFNQPIASTQISLSNSIVANAISLIAGSPSDNALITATCTFGDTCKIYNQQGNVLASGTNTVTLAYNTLPLGYSTLYANDITLGSLSGNVYIRRVATVNSLAITLTNTQNYAIPANAQLDIAFSGHNYTSVESNTLNNTILYFQNGTVDYSWLEGGVTASVEYSANVLSTSANVFFWFKVPSSTFLPANTGVATTNVLYMGFGTPGVNLMDGNFTGEAPQLSVNYAQYDNGAKIFNYYLVNPTSLAGFTTSGDATLSTSGVPTGSYFDTPNAFSATDNSDNNYLYGSSSAFAPGNVITYWFNVPESSLGDLFFMASSSGAGQFSRIDERGSNTDSGILSASSWSSWTGSGNIQNPALGSWDKVDVIMTNSISATMYDTPTSNTPLGTLGSASSGPITVSYDGNFFGINSDSGGVSSPPDYWDAIIVRDYLPGGSVILSTPSTASYYVAPTSPSISPSSQTIVPGENVVITTSGISGGISPYTYQWYASPNSIPAETAANALEANDIIGTGTSNGRAQSPNISITTGAETPLLNYYFVLYVTDSYPTTVSSPAAEVSVVGSLTQSTGGSNAPASYATTISDNINSSLTSAQPVVSLTGGGQYHQNQLPVSITASNPTTSFSFSCNVTINGYQYNYQNDVYGLGFGIPCGTQQSSNSKSIEIIYGSGRKIQTQNTTNATVEQNQTIQNVSVEKTTTQNSTVQIQQKQVTVKITVAQTQNQSVEICNQTSPNGYTMNYPEIGSSFQFSQSSTGCFDFSAFNVTSVTNPKVPGKTTLLVINVSTTSPAKEVNATVSYPCGAYSLSPAPYILLNSSWHEIIPYTINASSCTISFMMPFDPILAILENQQPIVQPTNVSTSNQPSPSTTSTKNGSTELEVEIGAVLLILVIIILAARKRKKSKK